MSEDGNRPPIRWFFGGPGERQAALHYWVRDPIQGGLNLAVHSALRALPTGLCSGFGAANAWLSPRRFPDSDARARRLWTALRPEASTPAEVDAAMRRLWRSVARTMAEYSVLHRLHAEGRIVVRGIEHVRAAKDAGRPGLVAGVHLGNWELIGATLLALGFRGGAPYEPPENRFEHRIANKVRLGYGGQIIYPKRDAGPSMVRALRQGDVDGFLLYIDEMREGRVSAPAFGRSSDMKGNIANIVRLARLVGADLIPAYCVRLGDAARFEMIFLPPLPQVYTADKDADLKANVAALDAVLAPIIAAHLDQWYYALDFEFES